MHGLLTFPSVVFVMKEDAVSNRGASTAKPDAIEYAQMKTLNPYMQFESPVPIPQG
jgi:hypothetical protein